MQVLSIGNSFSVDATRYLHDIAKADGVRLASANLYIAGCPLDRHYRNMYNGEPAYELQYDGHMTGFFVSLDDALLNRAWDVVTLQQVSSRSFDADSYQPYISALVDHVRECQPGAKIILHQTWAYETGSAKLQALGKFETAQQMAEEIQTAYARIAKEIGADGIIPAGELFTALLAKGIPSVQRDTFHASLGLGRYALGLLWYRMLTGNSVAENSFACFDKPIPPEEIQIAKACVDSFAPLF